MKRVAIFSDTHCGSLVGLTPPDWQRPYVENDKTKLNKFVKLQNEAWKWFKKNIEPVDVAIWNGDLIDGDGFRSGGTELLIRDMNRQAEMAAEVIETVGAKHNVLISGTPYHVGRSEDFESSIANITKIDKVGAHEWVDVGGIVFDCKHKIGSSVIPHGRYTAPHRDKLWSILWQDAGLTPKADIIIRSHVHYCTASFDGSRWVFTTPALQCMGTRFGSRQCSGLVHFGFILFTIDKKGEFDFDIRLADLYTQKTKTLKY